MELLIAVFVIIVCLCVSNFVVINKIKKMIEKDRYSADKDEEEMDFVYKKKRGKNYIEVYLSEEELAKEKEKENLKEEEFLRKWLKKYE